MTNTSDIQSIIIKRHKRIGKFYVLVDGVHSIAHPSLKDATIFISYGKKGKEFIESFYKGEIPVYKK